MPPVAEEVARARSLAALTAAACEWPAEQTEAAEQIADRLGLHASAVVDAAGAVPSCGDTGCTLERHTAGPAAVRLAPALAAAHGRRNGDGASARENGPGATRHAHDRYVQSLRDAAAVVYCCRRVLHTSGQCFFDTGGTGSGLCGRVLAVSHRLEHDLALRP